MDNTTVQELTRALNRLAQTLERISSGPGAGGFSPLVLHVTGPCCIPARGAGGTIPGARGAGGQA